MSITTQDFNKGLDLSEQTEIQATQINQMLDVARPASDKGLVLETTDTAEDTPVVPNPDLEQESVTPIWWKRYIWKRNVYGGGVYCYVWDPEATSDEDFYQWVRLDQDAANAQTDATSALTNAAAALATASGAQSSADDATALATESNVQAVLAQSMAQDAQNTADSVVGSHIKTGMIIPFIGTTVFSKEQDDGWLELDGSSVPKDTYPALAALLGATGSTFTLPDWRGRAIIGAGHGDGLTSRALKGTGGQEDVILTAAQTYHRHVYGQIDATEPFIVVYLAVTRGVKHVFSSIMNFMSMHSKVSGEGFDQSGSDGEMITSEPIEYEGNQSSSHTNMMPWGAARWLIKT